jgi:hypothetical protein
MHKWLATGMRFSLRTKVSTNITGHRDEIEILLKEVLNTVNLYNEVSR